MERLLNSLGESCLTQRLDRQLHRGIMWFTQSMRLFTKCGDHYYIADY